MSPNGRFSVACALTLLLLLAGPLASAQEGPAIEGPGGVNTTPEDGAAAGGDGEGGERVGANPQDVGGYQAQPGSGLFGLLVVLALLGGGYLWYRKRGGRLME